MKNIGVIENKRIHIEYEDIEKLLLMTFANPKCRRETNDPKKKKKKNRKKENIIDNYSSASIQIFHLTLKLSIIYCNGFSYNSLVDFIMFC